VSAFWDLYKPPLPQREREREIEEHLELTLSFPRKPEKEKNTQKVMKDGEQL
jgi:hypothetical protein